MIYIEYSLGTFCLGMGYQRHPLLVASYFIIASDRQLFATCKKGDIIHTRGTHLHPRINALFFSLIIHSKQIKRHL